MSWPDEEGRLWIGQVKTAMPGYFELTNTRDGVYFERDQEICFGGRPGSPSQLENATVSGIDRTQGLVSIYGWRRAKAGDYVFTNPPGMQLPESERR